MIISAIRVIVNLKVTQIATRGSLASTVSDSESDDDAFLGPVGFNQSINQSINFIADKLHPYKSSGKKTVI